MTRTSCDRRRLSLALIAAVANAAYTTLAPILPLELDKRGISERWASLIFLAFSIGSSAAPPLVARHLERVGTVKAIVGAMAGMSVLFWCLGCIFDIVGSVDEDANRKIVGLLALLQFLMGVFFSSISTGYYSLATLVFAEKESAMTSIEASLGVGYILGPILGTIMYDEMGYRYAYQSVSLGMMLMAVVTWKFISPVLTYTVPEADDDDDFTTDLEAQNMRSSYESFESDDRTKQKQNIQRQPMDINAQQSRNVEQLSTLLLLKHPAIFFAATNILWVNVSWTFVEPLLAGNIVYVPAVFLVQCLGRFYTGRHRIITLSTALTPIAVLLMGSGQLSLVVLGIASIGLFPTPVWVMLLPFMQEESAMLFPEPNVKRRLNDVTAGVYNMMMTLGQVAGYAISALLGPHGFALTTRVVALLIFLQSAAFYFCTIHPRRKRGCTDD